MAYIGKDPRLKSIVSEGDTLANLTAEPRTAGRHVYATDTKKFYLDDGVNLLPLASEPTHFAVPAVNIDWSAGDVQYKSISAATTFTFSNAVNGSTIIVAIAADGVDRTVAFPAGILKSPNYSGIVVANTESVFTFVRANNKIYLSEIGELS